MSVISLLADWCAAVLGVPAAPIAGPAKPAIRGLTSMGYAEFVDDPSLKVRNDLAECIAHPGIYAGAVINLKWSDLEPTSGSYDFSSVESALGAIQSYNAAHPRTPLSAKLRVFAGANCPAWVYQTIGAVDLVTATPRSQASKDTPKLTYSYFWSAAYEAAWAMLMNALAASYDANSSIATISVSSASSHTAEPFNIGSNPQNTAALLAAGFTDAQWQQALTNAADDYAGWQTTNLDFPFNPLLTLQATPMVASTAMPIALMQAFRASLAGRAVVSNHALAPSARPGSQEPEIWSAQKTCGAPIAFQTAGPDLDLGACVTTAASYGCTEMEIWDSTAAGGSAKFTEADLQTWSAQIMANAR